MSQRFVGLMMAVLTGVCWSVLAIALKYATSFASSGQIVWVRMLVALVALILYFAWQDPKGFAIFKAMPPIGVAAAFAIAANYFGYMKCIELTTASHAQIMIQLAPLSLLVIGIVYFKEKPSPLQWAGVFIALTGFALFFLDQILQAVSDRARFLEGNLWVLMAAITWAYFAAVQKLMIKKWTPGQFNLLMYALCTVFLLPLAEPQALMNLSAWQWFFLFLLGMNTVVAYGAFSEALKRIPASHVSLIISTNPLLTIFLLALMAHFHWDWIRPEPIHWRGYLGALFVVSGVAMAVARPPRWPKAV